MTDNIQKLYEVAGVEETRGVELTIDPTSEETKFNKHYVCYGFPPFTAEKQLELIKWLSQDISQNCILHIDRWTSGKVRFALDKEKYTEPYYELDYACGDKDFSQALAGLILQLWDELSSEQREEVREILQ